MKIFTKFFVLGVFLFTMVLGSITSVNANSIDPQYATSCPESHDGRHHMYGIGLGTVQNTSGVKVFDGYAYQCRYCNEVMITQGNMALVQSNSAYVVGKWATWNPGYALSNGHVTMKTPYINPFLNARSIPGYVFFQ